MKKWILVLFAANMLSITALADIYVEPSLGYNFGSYEAKLTAPLPAAPGGTSGLGLGLKAGYSIATFFGGLDVQYNMLSSDPDSASQPEDDLKETLIGISGGMDLVLIRAWLGYYFSGSGKSDDVEFKSGSGFKIGVGYSLLPMVSLNAEYFITNYDDVTEASGFVQEMDFKNLLVSVSVPLSF